MTLGQKLKIFTVKMTFQRIFSNFLCWLFSVVPLKKDACIIISKILDFYFKKDFLISFSSTLALFQKTTCKAFISNSEWVCRFKVERFVKMVINKEKSNWNWAFQKNPLTSIAALKSLWLFEFSRQKLIIRAYNWKVEFKFKYWKNIFGMKWDIFVDFSNTVFCLRV